MTSTAALEFSSYPHIFDLIVKYAPYEALLRLRLTSRHALKVANKALLTHVAVGTRKDDRPEVREPTPPFRLIPLPRQSDRFSDFSRLAEACCIDYYGVPAGCTLPSCNNATVRCVWGPQRNSAALYGATQVSYTAWPEVLYSLPPSPPVHLRDAGCISRHVQYIRLDVSGLQESARHVVPDSNLYSASPRYNEYVLVFDVFNVQSVLQDADGCGLHALDDLISKVASYLNTLDSVRIVGVETLPSLFLCETTSDLISGVHERFFFERLEAAYDMIFKNDTSVLPDKKVEGLSKVRFISMSEWQQSHDWRETQLPPIQPDIIGSAGSQVKFRFTTDKPSPDVPFCPPRYLWDRSGSSRGSHVEDSDGFESKYSLNGYDTDKDYEEGYWWYQFAFDNT